jgi:hypothetical protein
MVANWLYSGAQSLLSTQMAQLQSGRRIKNDLSIKIVNRELLCDRLHLLVQISST